MWNRRSSLFQFRNVPFFKEEDEYCVVTKSLKSKDGGLVCGEVDKNSKCHRHTTFYEDDVAKL